MTLAIFRAVLLSGASWLPYMAIGREVRPRPAPRIFSSSSVMTDPAGWAP